MAQSVILRTVEKRDLTAEQPLVVLLSVDCGDALEGSRALHIRGIALQVASVAITASTSADSADEAVDVTPEGFFEVDLEVDVSGPHDFLILEAIDAQPAGAGAAFDRAVVQLGALYSLSLPSPTLANLDVARLSYLAGTPDRLIPSRTFVQLNLPLKLANRSKADTLYFGGNGKKGKGGKYQKLSMKSLASYDKESKKLAAELDAGKISVSEYYKRAGKAYASAVEDGVVPVPQAEEARLEKAMGDIAKGAAVPKAAKSPKAAPASAGRAFVSIDSGGKKSFFLHPDIKGKSPSRGSRAVDRLLEHWEKAIKGSQRVGIIFLDRLRLQPVGLVVGEPLYKLSLSPGEEVQLRQSSETRKRMSLQEIRDREAEQSLTLSSTLSTDLTSTVSDTRSFQSQTSLGGGLSGTIPETPIGVSVQAGTSASSANNMSSSETATHHNETSSQSMARLRAQHKTTLEITTEESTGYTSTRTLRNANQQRSQVHTFFKLYRKERITLERHDAQLCIRIEVLDPARETRIAFLNSFHKLDPNNKANWDLPEFGDVPKSADKTISEPADKPASDAFGGRHDRWATMQIADIKAFLGAPSGYELIDSPKLVMKSVTLFTENSDLEGIEGTHVHTDAVTRETAPENVELQWAFVTAGGKVKWVHQPEPLADDGSLKLDVNFAFDMVGRPPIMPFIELGTKIVSVTFQVSATFGAGDELMQQRYDKLLRRKREVTEAFDPASIYALAAAARADYPASVLERAIRENFADLSMGRMQVFSRVFEFDKVIVENVPYWGSRESADAHFELKWLLEKLPKRVAADQVLTPELTGSTACIYLPIRHGMEQDALDFLDELDAGQRASLILDFNELRAEQFGLRRPAATLTPEDIDVPTTVPATVAGNGAQWESPWESTLRNFTVLAEWSDLSPTDGLHIETQLSATTVADEAAKSRLERLG